MGAAAPDPRSEVDLSLVLPAYNEGRTIAQAVRNAAQVLGGLSPSYEIVVVNDGSVDDTRATLDALVSEVPALRPVHLRRNAGQHMATVVGLFNARGAYVVTADADEQVPFDHIPTIYEAIRADPSLDIVSGARSVRNSSLYRDAGSRFLSWIVNRTMKSNLRDPGTPFRILRADVVRALLDADALAQNIPILIAYLGFRNREIEVEAHGSAGRKSSYGPIKLIHTLMLAMLNFSSGTTTILTLMAAGTLSSVFGVAGLAGVVLNGILQVQPLPTNWLLFFVLLVVLGLQFVLVGAVAYKVERLNSNLRFRQSFALLRKEMER